MSSPISEFDEHGPLATIAASTCGAGSAVELRRFAILQLGLAPMFRRVFADSCVPRVVVIVPSMSLEREELEKLTGAPFYEERLLCLLLLLRFPTTRIVYLTSEPVAPAIVDYYLRLLPPNVRADAWRRLTMLSCRDGSNAPLTAKLLDRPELLARVRAAVGDPASAHITCFNVTRLERTLAVRPGFPIYGCDPALEYLGTKSGSRDVFREAGVAMPPGYEHLHSTDDIARALALLKQEHPSLSRAVVKLDEGFSGEGNAIFAYEGAPPDSSLLEWIRAELPTRLRFVAPGETWTAYRAKFTRMGGIVEAMVCGREVRSPSVQCRIDPLGATHVVSTHDQMLGGETGQVFLGCTFPAAAGGRDAMHRAGRRVAALLARRGVIGRFSIDFVVTREGGDWACHAIEINLRKGGTTHPFLTLAHLTDGEYDEATGQFRSATGQPCFYVASDNVSHPAYGNLDVCALFDVVRREGLHFDASAECGVVLHLIGALGEHGKLGATVIGRTLADAEALFRRTVAVLDRESGRAQGEAIARRMYEAGRDGRTSAPAMSR